MKLTEENINEQYKDDKEKREVLRAILKDYKRPSFWDIKNK